MRSEYSIRLQTARLHAFSLANGNAVELVTATGLGEHTGKQMVKIGEVYDGEEDIIHMALEFPEDLIRDAVEGSGSA